MRYLSFLLLLLSSTAFAQKTENVILITLDGYRWQELFTGAEQRLMSKEYLATDSAALAKQFWADTPEQRREKLMPFMWNVVAKQGQLYGNRAYNNFVNVSNKQWFSYPGYSELLCGFPDDARIHSNDKFANPNTNVLEFIQKQPKFAGKVAAFSSWDCFPFIINSERSKVPVNAGITETSGNPNDREKWLNEIMHQVPNPLGEVRLDAFTFNYAFEYLKKNKPRVLYLALDETDDFAHGGKYDLYLRAANYTDQFFKTLWDWCQSDPQYRAKTTMIITCDHGRGSINKDDWRHHGIEMQNSDQIWVAVIGPDTAASGEIKVPGQLFQNQVARTISRLLGLDYQNNPAPGQPLGTVIGSK
ncbi:MAG TPA: alkaline phosphatase family protein [Cyclobacteriaceae bacterium]|nr:alkaline phosphatase family protein [Cyclobacteriaceae bacterium]